MKSRRRAAASATISPRWWDRGWYAPLRAGLIALLLLLLGLLIRQTVLFVGQTGQAVAVSANMSIDTASYLRAARTMLANGDWLFTPDIYHAGGMSIYLSWLLRALGEDFAAMKFLTVGWWLAGMASLAAIVRHAAHNNILFGLLAAVLYASSLTARTYCAILQYEIVLCGFLMVLTYVSLVAPQRPWAEALSGFGIFVLCVFRAHFVGILLLLTVLLAHRMLRTPPGAPRQDLRRAIAVLTASFLVPALLWNAYYSFRMGQVVFFQTGFPMLFDRFLNPNAQGWDYPFPPVVPPAGLQFILERPGSYVALLGPKALYLFGFLPEIWHVESFWTLTLSRVFEIPVETARKLFATFYMTTFAAGLGVRLFRLRHEALTSYEVYFLGLLLSIAATQLIHGSSTRFLVPALPAILYFQMYWAMPRRPAPSAA